jgi:hypothetical protein
MRLHGDATEVQYYILENYFYWKNKEKTLYTLNLCVLAIFALIPLWIIPIRYIIVGGMWIGVASNSPFFMALFKSLVQLGLE